MNNDPTHRPDSAAGEPDGSASPRSQRELCDRALRSLSKKIRGYTAREVKTVYEYDAEGEKRVKSETIVRKPVPPDLSAITFTLTSLNPHRWNNKPVAGVPCSGDETPPDLSRLSEEALREIAGLDAE